MRVEYIILFCCLLIHIKINCQSSYVINSSLDNYWHPAFIASYPNHETALGITLSQSTQLGTKVVKLDVEGNTIWSRRSQTLLVSNIKATTDGGMAYVAVTDNDIQGDASREILIKLDSSGNLAWQSFLLYPPAGVFSKSGLDIAPSGDIFASTHDSIHVVRRLLCTRINPDGMFIWSKGVSFNELSCSPNSMKYLSDGSIAVGGILHGNQQDTVSMVVKLSYMGDVEWVKTYENFTLTELAGFPDGHLLLIGKTNSSEAVVMKTTEDGQIVWSYALPILSVEQFSRQSASVSPDGSVIMGLILPNRTAGMIKMNADGVLIWAKGYTKASMIVSPPAIYANGSIGLLITATGYGLGNSKGCFIKTDTNGYIQDCPVVDWCPVIRPFHSDVSTIQWVVADVTFEQFAPVSIYPAPMVWEDACRPLQLADASFSIPATICLGDSINPVILNPTAYDSVFWHFEGGLPFWSSDVEPQAILFPNTGRYNITHIVYANGCVDSLTIAIDVLSLPSLSRSRDTLVCGEEYHLDVTTEGISSYWWEDGGSTPVRKIEEGGVYSIVLSNGVCEATDSVSVAFLHEKYPDIVLDLGQDTIVCRLFLPLVLDVQLPYANIYAWENGLQTPQRYIDEEGIYRIRAWIDGCPLEDEIEVVVDDCSDAVYIPDIFSPNSDGINDYFLPQSKDVELIDMKIYDRWGSLLFQTKSAANGWDGTNRQAKMPVGVYVYIMNFVNIKTKYRFQRSGDIMLVR